MLFHVACLAATAATAAAATVDYDVVVYGSTPAGVAAATAAGQLGMKVAVYEPLHMIGGMGAAGALGLHDGPGIGGGLAMVWQMLNAKAYNITSPVLQPESFVGEASFYTMLKDASVTVVKTDCHVTAATTSKSQADGVSRVESISVVCEPDPITATVFIDASYDGDLMVAAGDVDYTWGREATTQYNETLAGARAPSWSGVAHPSGIDALKPDGTLLKYVKNISELGAPGSADDALMAFQHRLCISTGDDMVPWPKPDGYNREDFMLMQRVLDATGSANAFTHMPPGGYHGYPGPKKKYDLCCGISVASSDQPNINHGWANASWEERKLIHADHTYFEMGTFYYLANDPAVPQAVREQYSSYGLCKDEFVDNNNIPYQLYVRISNRLVGDYVMTQNNICQPRWKPDSVAVGDWSFDEHMTGKYAVPDKTAKSGYSIMLEGNFWPSIADGCPGGGSGSGGRWSNNGYDVPYSIMTPKKGTGGNLLVPVALSASAVAYSSTRIESMFMYTGTAAGVAAKQVVDGTAATVQEVNVTEVQELLTGTFHQIIHLNDTTPRPAGPAPPYYNVTGAGTAQWNGHYVRQAGGGAGGTVASDGGDGDGDGGALMYMSTEPACVGCSIYEYNDVWRIAIQGKVLGYTAPYGTALPPTAGWHACPAGAGAAHDGAEAAPCTGIAPAPVLIAGPTH